MNKLKGDAYEHFVCDYLNKNGSIAYLWKDVPPKLLVDANLYDSIDIIRKNKIVLKNNPSLDECENLFMDVGIDILQIKDGKFIFVQCKCGYEKHGVGIHDLNGFFMQLVCNPDANGAIYYTDKISNKVEHVIKRAHNLKIESVQIPFVFSTTIATTITNTTILPKFYLYEYQQKAVTDITNHFNTNNKCILSFPCACGKTITSYYVALNYKYVFIVSPYKCHSEQNLCKFQEYNENVETKHILINCDGCRKVDKILQLMNGNSRVVLSSTFDSVDVVNLLIKSITDSYIVIVDEFHNLSKNDVGIYENDSEEDDDEEINCVTNIAEHPQNEMNKLITTANKILFVSATPRVYEIQGCDDESFNKNLFGENIATMTFNEAITKKYIADYKIYVPSIGETYDELTASIENEINIKLVKNDILAKCMFLMKGFCNNGNKKCIVYCRRVSEISQFQKMFKTLDAYYALDLKYYTITADTNNRNAILQQFSDDEGYSIIFSIRVLDEAIDIPKCDSIYISYSSDAIVRNVQRVFRCNRIDKNNVNKIGHVYVYCDKYKELLNVFASLKEYDCRFSEKIEIMNMKLNETRMVKSNIAKQNEQLLIEKYLVDVVEYKIQKFNELINIVDKYIEENDKFPSSQSPIKEIRTIGIWRGFQNKRYKQNIMKVFERELWKNFVAKHGMLFADRFTNWFVMLNKADLHISLYDKRPNSKTGNIYTKKLGRWIMTQNDNYGKNYQMMQYENTRIAWEKFLAKYKEHFLNHEETWHLIFDKMKAHIEKNNKRPSRDSNIDKIRELGVWISSQVVNYNNICKIMKNETIRKKWECFISNYPLLFAESYKILLKRRNAINT